MSRPPKVARHDLERLLIRAGAPVSATDLATTLRVNRTTVVRCLTDFGDDELITFGATRSTRYALRRSIPGAGSSWPIYRLDETGRASEWAMLEALHDRLWRIVWVEEDLSPAWADRFSDANGIWEGFPLFLTDVRPQGFLGRAIARHLSRLIGVPEDPGRWSDHHTMIFLQAAGEDLPGAFVVGDDCLRRAQARALSPDPREIVEADRCPERYAEMAETAMDSLPGSSAGGEQPKFLAHVRDGNGEYHPVLVKFSPPLDQATGRRWADLMVCEHLAAEVLSGRGHAPSGTRVLDSGERRFFEIPRFDRVGLAGRRGVVTLAALHAEADSYGSGRAWVKAAASMREDELIGDETYSAVLRLHAFGELIGNTDMHAGNLGFWLEDALPFRLAPAFDMLPMLWAPGPQGEIIPRDFVPSLPLPAVRSEWREAAEWAEEFWDRAAIDPRLSADFAGFAQEARKSVASLRKREG